MLYLILSALLMALSFLAGMMGLGVAFIATPISSSLATTGGRHSSELIRRVWSNVAKRFWLVSTALWLKSSRRMARRGEDI
jgi:uncharacterized membrane protein YfcA